MALRVLTIDGGGIRGLIPARVLVELEQVTGRPTAELFDLIAGTAGGAILALGLVAPRPGDQPRFSAEDLFRLYLQRGQDLFPQPDPLPRLRRLLGLDKSHPASAPLAEHFGHTPLGDALVDVIVPTFDAAAAVPLVLRSDEFASGKGPPMSDVALASSTMPTHFPSVRVEFSAQARTLTHGGVVANNPAGFAYAAALAKAPPEEVVVVSLGTGGRAGDRVNGIGEAGAEHWPVTAGPSFELQLDASSEAQHQMLDALLAATGHRDRYWRLQPSLQTHPHDYSLSDPAVLGELAGRFVAGVRPDLNEIADAVAA